MFNVLYPRGGSAVWSENSVAAQVIDNDFFGGKTNIRQSKRYGSQADSTSHTVNFDLQPVSGNQLFLFVTANDANVTTPSGWTRVLDRLDFVFAVVFRKTAGASEPSSVGLTIGSVNSLSAVFLEVSGLSSTIDQSGSQIFQGSNGIIQPPEITTAVASQLLFSFASYREEAGSVLNWGDGFEEVAEVLSANGSDADMGVAVAVRETFSLAKFRGEARLSATGSGNNIGIILGFQTATESGSTELSPSIGDVQITGIAPVLSFTAAPASGAVVFTGIAPELSVSRLLSPSVGEISVQGISPALSFTLQTGIGQCLVSGIAPALIVSLLPGVASLLFDGITPGIDRVVSPGIGELQIDGSPVSFLVSVSPDTGQIVFEGQSPGIEYILLPGGGALVLTGEGPSFVLGSAPLPGSLVFTGIVPNISVVSSQVKLKLWDGAAFTTGRLKMWNGTEFIEGRLRRYLGNGNFD